MILFIRIPKNASTSLYESFGRHNIIDNRKEELLKKLSVLSWWQKFSHPSHVNLETIKELLGKEALDLLKVCCVRNPYDRIVSAYEFTKKFELWRIYTDTLPAFKEFTEEYCRRNQDIDFGHAHTQTRWITLNGKLSADVILRFENLTEDFNKFVSDYGYSFKLSHLNKTNHIEYQDYYDSVLSDLVYESYKDDFVNFNYQKLNKELK